jgi:hypothetical protein
MNRELLEEMTLYGVAGEPARIDNIIIIPAFYEFFPELAEDDISYDEYCLEEYLTNNNCKLSQICPRFALFSREHNLNDLGFSCDAIWVHAKIIDIFQYYPPPIDWCYNLPDFSFLAIMLDECGEICLIHPFACIELNLQSYLEFYKFTPLQDRALVANLFWKLLVDYYPIIIQQLVKQQNCN